MAERKTARDLLQTIRRVQKISDLTVLLEAVLHEARTFVDADAGTLYLAREGRLFFSYIENDTLFPDGNAKDKYVYSSNSIPIDKTSLAGYVASTGEALMIDNVYDIKSQVSYSFNPAYDKLTSYKTQSILVVPLMKSDTIVVGVLQLINKKDRREEVVPFHADDRLYITYFAEHAADAVEKADMSRQTIMRMVEMAELRDPRESVEHARRVGDYALELFDFWASKKGVPSAERNIKKDIFRAAAILHDVGKVGLSDAILAKQGAFTDADKLEMYRHTIYGARLFQNGRSIWDRIAYEVVLNHHERWDGSGYPGKIADINAAMTSFSPGKKGKEIPLSARIVAIADVFDALTSDRPHKQAWTEERTFEYLRDEAGKKFDPELVQHFLEIRDVLHAIRIQKRESVSTLR
ncbi:MAG: HD domain-containing protein [Spirochaetaceae bacterium]|nr:MAG: HD domain-containing protein [Spirochaetaceae bacterium]